MFERQAHGTRANRKRGRERKRDLDEANSKRDVLLIILTPGVRLNERKSQTHEAQCKFNYREKGRLERAEGKVRHNERKRERERANDADPGCRLCAGCASASASAGYAAVPPYTRVLVHQSRLDEVEIQVFI